MNILKDSTGLESENGGKNQTWVSSSTLDDQFQGLNNIGCPYLVHWLPVVIYSGKSIFEYDFIREYEPKMEKASDLVWGPYDDQAVINNSENLVGWTVPLSPALYDILMGLIRNDV